MLKFPRSLEMILEAVSEASCISVKELKSKSRKGDVVIGRAAYLILAKSKGYSLDLTGKLVDRDHTTVIHHCKNNNEYQPIVDIIKDANKILEGKNKDTLAYDAEKPKLKPEFYKLIFYRPSLRAELKELLKGQDDDSLIALAKAQHPIFSQLYIAEIILVEYNKSAREKISISDMIVTDLQKTINPFSHASIKI
jgi:hypothetical protein